MASQAVDETEIQVNFLSDHQTLEANVSQTGPKEGIQMKSLTDDLPDNELGR
jgi:hypothetical protein